MRCEVHGHRISGDNLCPICKRPDIPLPGASNRNPFPPSQKPSSPLALKLSSNERIIMHIDAWYLILSAILRADPPFKLNRTLSDAMLTAMIQLDGREIELIIPQPPEFIEDIQEKT